MLYYLVALLSEEQAPELLFSVLFYAYEPSFSNPIQHELMAMMLLMKETYQNIQDWELKP